MILSDGTLWEGSPAAFPGFGAVGRIAGLDTNDWGSYAEVYRRQLWVAAVVNKLAMGEARLPLKVYEHDEFNRPEAVGHPYAELLRRPNRYQSRFFFWLWTVSTFDVHGESFWGKLRDKGGRPTELVPLHPTGMRVEGDVDGELHWRYQNGNIKVTGIPQSDLVHFKTFNPDTPWRGMSRLEPLRRTLEFEDAAQRAQSSFWSKSARPSVLLSTEKVLSQGAIDRLSLQWNQIAGGVDNTGRTIVLEEGLKPEKWMVNNDEAQYIDSRKLNREEVCAVFDVPPPAVHILDRATFSNITEQLRSLYRDTHAPRLQLFESTLEAELRSARQPGASEPDFGDDVYAEFLLDEVLRGDFEVRATAYQQADYMTMAEKRTRENLPFIEGTDRIFVNAANVPMDVTALNAVGSLVRSGYDPEAALAALGLPAIAHTGNLPVTVQADPIPAPQVRSMMGRLSRATQLADVDPDQLVAGVDPVHALAIVAAFDLSTAAGHTVRQFRDRIKSIAGGTP